MKQKICVIGLGYIGLPTAAMFATHGHEVIGVDVDTTIVNALNQREIKIEEPYLDILVQAAVTSGNLMASNVPQEADAFIIAVPTPITKDKKADMSYVEAATISIVPFLRKGNIVVLESTSPVGTVENLMIPILKSSGLNIGEELFLGHSPERVLPGQILMELVNNNRIIGGINEISGKKIRDLYQTFVRGEIYLTDATTAEMCKLMENTYRDVNIALANELGKICEKIGINAWDVIKICNNHPRVNLHQPGPGVGGHCLAVDPWFIVESNPDLARIIHLAREINDDMPKHTFERIEEILMNIDGIRKVTVLGLTYKANVNDVRESPIMELVELLDQQNYEIALFDPHIKGYKHQKSSVLEAAKDSDLLVLAVNHDAFKHLPFEDIGKVMRNKNVFDTRNWWDKGTMKKAGFDCYLLGNG